MAAEHDANIRWLVTPDRRQTAGLWPPARMEYPGKLGTPETVSGLLSGVTVERES